MVDVCLTLCAHRDIGDLAAHGLFQILDVVLGLLGQVFPLAGGGDVAVPAGQILHHRLCGVQSLAHGEAGSGGAVAQLVSSDHGDLLHIVQHVQQGQGDLVAALAEDAVAACHQVDGADAAGTAGSSAVLVAGLAQVVLLFLGHGQLSGKGAVADAGGISLHDADGVGQLVARDVDEIALVIKHEGTIYDLMKVEQAYAPPFSSAKDPVAVAGYVAENIITGKVQPVYWRQLRDIEMENNFLLDVRTPDEFSLNTLPGAVNIPLDELRDRLDELPKDKMIYTFCAVGLRGYLAYRILVQHGFEKVRNLSGGLKTYHAAAAPIILREESENEVPAQPNANIQQPADAQPQKTVSPVEAVKTIRVDACGLQCPGPILKMKKTMDSLVSGDRVEITSTDPGFPRDAAAWCNSTGNQLISKEAAGGKSVVVIEKGEPKSCNIVTSCEGKGKTFIMFSDDLDKALATFVLANGAAATGQKVTIFFTFWGLNVIKKLHKPNVEKDIFGKMFGMMLPSSSRKLKLSKMSMGGIGGKMMRYIMNRKGIDSLESLRQQALENGVEFIACQMSMDVMGVKQEELLDEVTIGGVATYMERADNANINLFI